MNSDIIFMAHETYSALAALSMKRYVIIFFNAIFLMKSSPNYE